MHFDSGVPVGERHGRGRPRERALDRARRTPGRRRRVAPPARRTPTGRARRPGGGPGPCTDRRVAAVRRSRYDGEILRLALPALGALAAEPALPARRHGDRRPPRHAAAGGARAGRRSCSAASSTLSIFLTYGTTAQVARLHGAGRDAQAGALAAQALWLALGARRRADRAGRRARARRAHGRCSAGAARSATWPRATCASARSACRSRSIALAGAGLAARRGRPAHAAGDRRSPRTSRTSCSRWCFVYGFGWGLDGSALGTVIAQAGMGAAFAAVLLRAPAATPAPELARIRPLASIGGELVRAQRLAVRLLHAGERGARARSARRRSARTRSPSSCSSSWRSCSTRSRSPGR